MDKDLYIEFLEETLKRARSNKTPEYRTKPAKKISKPMHRWTDDEKLQMMIWRGEGMKVSEIARRLGLRRSQVDNMIYSLESRAK